MTELPFTRTELHEKWTDCASLVLQAATTEQVFGIVEKLEDLTDVTELVRALTAPARTATR